MALPDDPPNVPDLAEGDGRTPLDEELAEAFKRWRASRGNWSGKTAAGQLVRTGNEWLEEKGLT